MTWYGNTKESKKNDKSCGANAIKWLSNSSLLNKFVCDLKGFADLI